MPKGYSNKTGLPLRLGKKPSIKTREKMGKSAKKSINPGRFKKGQNSGKNHPKWKGGQYQRFDGHWYIWKPNHPFANHHGYIRRSRLVIEKKIGRYLTSKEVVHHINRNPSDDRSENLMLFPNNCEHMKFHKIPHDKTGRFTKRTCQ